jgi:hypothetical protein
MDNRRRLKPELQQVTSTESRTRLRLAAKRFAVDFPRSIRDSAAMALLSDLLSQYLVRGGFMKDTLLAITGAVVGGILGFFAFGWVLSQGFYGLILPGGLLGLGAAIGRPRSIALAVAFGLAALALGLFTEWWYFPFKKDEGFAYFLMHIPQLKPLTLLMIAAGGVLGFWVPFRRSEPPHRSGKSVQQVS